MGRCTDAGFVGTWEVGIELCHRRSAAQDNRGEGFGCSRLPFGDRLVHSAGASLDFLGRTDIGVENTRCPPGAKRSQDRVARGVVQDYCDLCSQQEYDGGCVYIYAKLGGAATESTGKYFCLLRPPTGLTIRGSHSSLVTSLTGAYSSPLPRRKRPALTRFSRFIATAWDQGKSHLSDASLG